MSEGLLDRVAGGKGEKLWESRRAETGNGVTAKCRKCEFPMNKWVAIRWHLGVEMDHSGHSMAFAGPHLLFLKKKCPSPQASCGNRGSASVTDSSMRPGGPSHGELGAETFVLSGKAYMVDSKVWDFSRFRQWHRRFPSKRRRKK